jgi:phage pi2 protein 07
MSKANKVSMTIDKENIIISKQCLHEFIAKDICIILYKALKTSKNEKRSTHECMKCVTRIKMKKVCNACYALAIGYSKKGVTKILA